MDKNYSYAELSNRLTKRTSVKIENNTIAYKVPDTTRINIDLHNNTIAQLTESTIILSSSGWMTVTTKDRLNKIIPYPYQINQSNGQWFIYNSIQRSNVGLFNDGLTINHYSGSGWSLDNSTTGQDNTTLRKSILKYCKGYMAALKRGEIESPSAGDCWYCSILNSVSDTDHLTSHIEESYYVPSLLYNAIQAYPVSMWAHRILTLLLSKQITCDLDKAIIDDLKNSKHEFVFEQVYNSLKKYMFYCFGIPT